MKQSINLYLRLIFAITTLSLGTIFAEQSNSYILKLNVPSQVINTQGLKAYYKGYQIDLSELWALLPECDNPLTFSILITENVDVKAKGNTIRYLKRIEDLDFKWYDLTLTFDNANLENVYKWTIEERDEESAPTRISENTLVILADPLLIESLATAPAQQMNNNISMPTVMFRRDISAAEFQESLICSLMNTLNLDAFHKKDRPACQKRHDAAVISIATQ
jgi:hypothetical protein